MPEASDLELSNGDMALPPSTPEPSALRPSPGLLGTNRGAGPGGINGPSHATLSPYESAAMKTFSSLLIAETKLRVEFNVFLLLSLQK